MRSPFARRKGFAALSEVERGVLRELALGRTVKEIARTSEVGATTIGTYRARILEKLGLRTTAELVRSRWGKSYTERTASRTEREGGLVVGKRQDGPRALWYLQLKSEA